jgi:hypothetical protein
MRDCIFLLADKNMQASIKGFFSKDRWRRALGCGSFDFEPRQDIHVAAGDNDPGLYTRAHELLRPFIHTHRFAVIVLDAAWEGSPGAPAIQDHISEQLESNGWAIDRFLVVVIEPELENWIWQASPHVAANLGFDSIEDMRADAAVRANWPDGRYKPASPKETMEAVLRKKRIPRSSSIYQQITSKVSVKQCKDAAFQELTARLRVWFPPEDVASGEVMI